MKKKLICAAVLCISILGTAHPAAIAAGKTVKVSVHNANIRSEAIRASAVIGHAARNEELTVLQEESGWYQVQLPNGQKGWIAGYLVSESGGQTISESATVTGDRLQVRSAPSLSSSRIGILNSGDRVHMIGEQGNWSHIRFNGSSAWVNSAFISKGRSESKSADGFAFIRQEGTNLRSDASTSAEVITTGSTGERYPIVGKEDDWYKINLASGREAYVASWVIDSQGDGAPAVQKSSGTASPGFAGKTIVLDAGHGGHDPGTSSAGGLQEKQLTLDTALKVKQKLAAAGANVILTRDSDGYVSLNARADEASAKNADAFISLHYDSSVQTQANGYTSYYHHNYQHGLAERIETALGEHLPLRSRGTQFGDYHVLRENGTPAALLELGYLSNPQEAPYIATDGYQQLVSDSIMSGLTEYFGN